MRCFVIRYKVVPFTLLEFRLGLSLRVIGQKVDLVNDDINCRSRSVFYSRYVSVHMIYDELMRRPYYNSVDQFCRLYILLWLSKFLLPHRMRIVFLRLFKIVYKVSELGKYNQRSLVYEYLISSLCCTSICMTNKGHLSHFHIVGCVYLLQVNPKV